jgi:BRCA1-associated protein
MNSRRRGKEVRQRRTGYERKKQKNVSLVLKEKTKIEHRSEKLGELSRKLDKELKEEKAVSEGLMANLARLKEKSELDEKKVRNWRSSQGM